MRGFTRCFDTFREVDWFDFSHSFINTRENVRDGYEAASGNMFYAPVYSSVLNEMICLSHDYWASAIRYSNFNLKTIFLDLGCGSGKTLIQAHKSKRFDGIYGVEIQESLASRCDQNLSRVGIENNKEKPVKCFNLNVTDKGWLETIKADFPSDSDTLFIFNKNSYNGDILNASLEIAESHFSTVIYLYQNPVASQPLIRRGYDLILNDSSPSTAHKNYKYSIFMLGR